MPAVGALDGKVWIVGRRSSHLGQRVRAASTTGGIHGRKWFALPGEHLAFGCKCGERGAAPSRGRLAKKLAVRGVTEIGVRMMTAAAHQIRA